MTTGAAFPMRRRWPPRRGFVFALEGFGPEAAAHFEKAARCIRLAGGYRLGFPAACSSRGGFELEHRRLPPPSKAIRPSPIEDYSRARVPLWSRGLLRKRHAWSSRCPLIPTAAGQLPLRLTTSLMDHLGIDQVHGAGRCNGFGPLIWNCCAWDPRASLRVLAVTVRAVARR